MKVPSSECAKTRASSVWNPRMKMQWKATGSVKRIASCPTAVDAIHPRRRDRDDPGQFPKMRAPVSTCTIANTPAAVGKRRRPETRRQ
jgi:hypothetical protein